MKTGLYVPGFVGEALDKVVGPVADTAWSKTSTSELLGVGMSSVDVVSKFLEKKPFHNQVLVASISDLASHPGTVDSDLKEKILEVDKYSLKPCGSEVKNAFLSLQAALRTVAPVK